MWHPIERIAEHQHLDEAITLEVAIENASQLSIVEGMVSTLHVEELIRLVRERQRERAAEGLRRTSALRQKYCGAGQ